MDLLAHKYRPESSEKFGCNTAQAAHLKQWIQDFLRASNADCSSKHHHKTSKTKINRKNSNNNNKDVQIIDNESQTDSEDPESMEIVNKCALITGPPGIGKTSLVYSVANELKLHVIESHPSEKRDFKLFSSLKLANQKGKINPIAKLFQAATKQQQQANTIFQSHKQENCHGSRKKRIKLSNPLQPIEPQQTKLFQTSLQEPKNEASVTQLSLSGDSSILLFDDIDVIFEDDGPFMKSLVEFIKETKRPVILTATKSLEHIKETLGCFELIKLQRPLVDDCAKVLGNICKSENYRQISLLPNSRLLAKHFDCDIRQCLNRIHFYGDKAAVDLSNVLDKKPNIEADFLKLELDNFSKTKQIFCPSPSSSSDTEIYGGDIFKVRKNRVLEPSDNNINLLKCFETTSLIDVMDESLNLTDKKILLDRWLDGIPSHRNEEHTNDIELGNQIRESILELNNILAKDELMDEEHLNEVRAWKPKVKVKFDNMTKCINEKIKSRVEPPDKEFYVELVPQFCQLVTLELENKLKNQLNGISSRRSRRNYGYLDTIFVYLDSKELKTISDGMIDLDLVE